MTSTTMASDLAREALEPGTRWRHKKRGHTYEVVGVGRMQADDWFTSHLQFGGVTSVDMQEAVIYRDRADGPIWVRPVSEFLDGRFEPLPRTAYDAIGSGVKVRELEWEHHPQASGQVRAPSPWGTYRIVFFGDYALWGCRADGLSLDNKAASIDEAKTAAQADFERRVLSCLTHTAAGAGPVGEADAEAGTWRDMASAPKDGSRFLAKEGDRHFDCWWHWFSADEVHNWQDDADSEPNPTHWMPLPVAASPVDKPGVVERLTRENVNLQTSLNNSVQGHCKTLERAETAEAALAETREELACTLEELIDHTGDDMIDSRQTRVDELRAAGPLPKTEADPARLTEALHDLLTRPTDPAARQRARAALSTQESSAALADGKEAGE